jgi:amino acid transporter
MSSLFKRIVVGRPLSTSEEREQRIRKLVALPTFSADAISSTAYATEEILIVLVAGSSSLALGLAQLVPLSIVVAVLLVIVVSSYRQTIFAYPNGGGSYIVSRENLGRLPSLVAAAALLIDYVLSVAVSLSAGVAAIVSLPALQGLAHDRVILGLGLIAIITVANLRGIRQSGALFAIPTYLYVVSMAVLIGYGLFRSYLGGLHPIAFDQKSFVGTRQAGGTLGLFLLLKGFSSGAIALTGVEAISNGVPAFKPDESRNAATTMAWMGATLGTLFFGVSVLAQRLHPVPSQNETVISQLGRAVLGSGPVYVVLQIATAAILALAANTAYADFPRVGSILARDGFLPRHLARRGDRLVFSNGILILALAAAALFTVFGGVTNALIPLYAVGVFTAFTLSQLGMIRHHRRTREPGWIRGLVISAVGAVATFIVLLIIAVTKFASGAWVPILLVPLIVAGFAGVHRHYEHFERALKISPADLRPTAVHHTVVVLVGGVHRGVMDSLRYARGLKADHLIALHVSMEEDDERPLRQRWAELGVDVRLDVVRSPHRDLAASVVSYIAELDDQVPDSTLTVVVSKFASGGTADNLLHNQSLVLLEERLLLRSGVAVAAVPYRRRAGL